MDFRDNFRGCRAAASYQDEVVQVLVAQLLPGPALARRLSAPLQLGLHVGLEAARLKVNAQVVEETENLKISSEKMDVSG